MSEEMNDDMKDELEDAGMADAGGSEVEESDRLWILLGYIFAPIIPIVLLLMEDKKSKPAVKFHAIQGLIFGILTYLLSAVCIGVIVWVYGIYIGWQVYSTGKSDDVPMISDMIRNQGWA